MGIAFVLGELCRYGSWYWGEREVHASSSPSLKGYVRWTNTPQGKISVGVLFLFSYLMSQSSPTYVEWILYLGMSVAIFFDLRFCWIPNLVLQGCVALGLVQWFSYATSSSSLLALFLGVFVLGSLYLLSPHNMGIGDIWFVAALGFWCTLWEMVLLLWLSFILGGLWAFVLWLKGSRRQEVPFTPFLGVSYYIAPHLIEMMAL